MTELRRAGTTTDMGNARAIFATAMTLEPIVSFSDVREAIVVVEFFRVDGGRTPGCGGKIISEMYCESAREST